MRPAREPLGAGVALGRAPGDRFDAAPDERLEHQGDEAVDMVVAGARALGRREPATDRATGADVRAGAERQPPARDVGSNRAVGIEPLRVGAEQRRVGVAADDVEDDERIGGDRSSRDRRLLHRPPADLRRRRSKPQRLVDHALGKEQVVGDAVEDVGLLRERVEQEVGGVDDGLAIGVRTALEVGGDLAHDAPVVAEVERRIGAMLEERRQDVVRQVLGRQFAAPVGIEHRLAPLARRMDKIALEPVVRVVHARPDGVGFLGIEDGRALAERVDELDHPVQLVEVALADVEAGPARGEHAGQHLADSVQIDLVADEQDVEQVGHDLGEERLLVESEDVGAELGVLDATSGAVGGAVRGADDAVADVALGIRPRVEGRDRSGLNSASRMAS